MTWYQWPLLILEQLYTFQNSFLYIIKHDSVNISVDSWHYPSFMSTGIKMPRAVVRHVAWARPRRLLLKNVSFLPLIPYKLIFNESRVSLGGKKKTPLLGCYKATEPMFYSYWACALEAESCNPWVQCATTTEAQVPKSLWSTGRKVTTMRSSCTAARE